MQMSVGRPRWPPLLHNCTGRCLQAEVCGPPEVATCGRDGAVRVWDVRQQDAPVAAFEPAPGEEVGCAPACTHMDWWRPPGHPLMKLRGSPNCCLGSHGVATFEPAPGQRGGAQTPAAACAYGQRSILSAAASSHLSDIVSLAPVTARWGSSCCFVRSLVVAVCQPASNKTVGWSPPCWWCLAGAVAADCCNLPVLQIQDYLVAVDAFEPCGSTGAALHSNRGCLAGVAKGWLDLNISFVEFRLCVSDRHELTCRTRPAGQQSCATHQHQCHLHTTAQEPMLLCMCKPLGSGHGRPFHLSRLHYIAQEVTLDCR